MTTTEVSTRLSRYWLKEDGIIYCEPGGVQTLADAQEGVRACAQLSQGKRRPLLVDLTNVKSVEREARMYYIGDESAKSIRACALLVPTVTARLIGNFFLGFNKSPQVSVKLFTAEAEAIEWLKEFLL